MSETIIQIQAEAIQASIDLATVLHQEEVSTLVVQEAVAALVVVQE